MLLIQTLPASRRLAIRFACLRSWDQIEAPSRIFVLLARCITSSSSVHGRIGTIGPMDEIVRG